MAAVLLLTAGCVSVDWIEPEEETESMVSFALRMDSGAETRAIADATADKLIIIAKDTETGEYRELYNGDNASEFSVRLVSGRRYEFFFWAQYAESRAYTIKDGTVSINYEAALDGGITYLDGGFARMKELDAFYAVQTVEAGRDKTVEVKLNRPVAQLNFADPNEAPQSGTAVTVTLKGVATSFDVFSGQYGGLTDKVFVFTDFPSEKLNAGDDSYNHLANIFLFPVTGVVADYQMTDQDPKEGINVSLEANKRTNVLGYFVQTPAPISRWDGITVTVPATDSENRYVIDEASDLAWLQTNGGTLEANSTFIVTSDIDMADYPMSSLQIPEGAAFEGGGRTIMNVNASGALMGNVTGISVNNLGVKNAVISSSTHTGLLVNTMYGGGSFNNISVNTATVTTSGGAAGGLVGYICRKTETDQSEQLSVTFDKCSLKGVAVSGSAEEGYVVGLLSGYDDGEKVIFMNSCTVEDDCSVADYTSQYIEGNESCWLEDTDFSAYDGWLGGEKYIRGKVYYGEESENKRFVRKWDGGTTVTPIAISGGKAIYSVFDLAACAATSPGKLEFRSDVDYAGNLVAPIVSLSTLTGNGHSIYNMYINRTWDLSTSQGGAFAMKGPNANFSDITFVDPHVEVHHSEASGTEGDARAAIVCTDVTGSSCSFENVHVRGGYLYGVNKMGGIAGYIPATNFTATGCTVDGLSIENYSNGIEDSTFEDIGLSGLVGKKGFTANGEIGGMFGFLVSNATISGCWVRNTKMDCVGVKNGTLMFLFKYSGRHVNEFIGDIRTINGEVINITYDSSDFTGNQYGDFNGNGEGGEKHTFKGCDKIGNCYYTNISIAGKGIIDTKGKLYVNGTELTIPNGYN